MTKRIRANSIQGVGLGLRAEHYQLIHEQQPPIPWFEVLADNYLNCDSPATIHLRKIAEHYPMVMHSVSMSIGGCDDLNFTYLAALKNIAKEINAAIISDHLCFVAHDGHYFHELLPLPYTEEALVHVSQRIERIQDFFGQRIALENVSSYLSYQCSELSEWEFLREVAERADCYLLLDVNNLYVSAHNHGFAPKDFYQKLPLQRIVQCHLAGYEDCSNYLLDSHGAKISDQVWQLYREIINVCGPIPTLIEWDNNIPDFSVLDAERRWAQAIMESVCGELQKANCPV